MAPECQKYSNISDSAQTHGRSMICAASKIGWGVVLATIRQKEHLTRRIDITTIIDMKSDYSRALPEEWKPLSKVFTALGDEHRQRILLLFEKGERLNVGQIAEVSTLTRSTVSHHLKILREAEVLASEKIGKEVWFWINRPYLESVLGNVLGYVQGNA
jgi:DNA-binding transcriptional ArsR family regulator